MPTTEEICSVWKQPYGCPRRLHMKEVFTRIYTRIPDDDDYRPIRTQFRTLLEKLWYSAPEILNNRWMDAYRLIRDGIPLTYDIKQDPAWVQAISRIWTDGNIALKKLDGIPVKIDTMNEGETTRDGETTREGETMAKGAEQEKKERIILLEKKIQDGQESGEATASQIKNWRRSLRRAKSA